MKRRSSVVRPLLSFATTSLIALNKASPSARRRRRPRSSDRRLAEEETRSQVNSKNGIPKASTKKIDERRRRPSVLCRTENWASRGLMCACVCVCVYFECEEQKRKEGPCPSRRKEEKLTNENTFELNAVQRSPGHRFRHVRFEGVHIALQRFCRVFVQRIVGIRFLQSTTTRRSTNEERRANLRTEKRKPMPRITERIVKTGFQSSLKAPRAVTKTRNFPLPQLTGEYSDKRSRRDRCSGDRSSAYISLSAVCEDIPTRW